MSGLRVPDDARSDPDDEFDRIVEHLDLDLSFPADDSRRHRHPSEQPPDDPGPDLRDEPTLPEELAQYSSGKQRSPDEPDDLAYRTPPPRIPRPPSRSRTAAWIAVLGGPSLLMLATLGGVILPRPIVLAAALTFVAASIFLFSQLPERGPSHPDWPDDGAVL